MIPKIKIYSNINKLYDKAECTSSAIYFLNCMKVGTGFGIVIIIILLSLRIGLSFF